MFAVKQIKQSGRGVQAIFETKHVYEVGPQAVSPRPSPVFFTQAEAQAYADAHFAEFVAAEKARLSGVSADRLAAAGLTEYAGFVAGLHA